MNRRHILAPVLLILTLGVLFVRLPLAIAERASDYATFDPVVEVYANIDKHFYRAFDHKALQEGAIRGIIEALDDPYTEFIPAQDIEEFDKYVRGQYVGIGASVTEQDGWLLIVSPLDDSPAYRAGIEANDYVVAVDGVSTWQRSTDEVIGDLSGKPGSEVTLTIERTGTEEDLPPTAEPPSVPDELGEAPGPAEGNIRFDVTLERERIVTSTVKGIHREGDRWIHMIDPERKIGYVRVSQFTNGTVPELREVCEDLVDRGLRGMILDLRFNGGGALAAAIETADLFLREGLIVSQRGRTTREERSYAQPEGTLPDFPLVVVVNGSSASASEIVAGALADNDRAVVLGERTFGKGLVQSLYRLESGAGQLKITEQHYYLPSGRSIQREDDSTTWGVDPRDGFYVPMTDEENRRMLRRRRDEEIIRETNPEECCWDDPEWILRELKDPQLSAAVEAIRLKLETGDWVPTGEEFERGRLELAALRAEEQRVERLLRELERSQKRIAALSKVAPKSEDPLDLIPGTPALTGGRMTITNEQGEEVATLRITGDTLERWLLDAPVEPIASDETGGE